MDPTILWVRQIVAGPLPSRLGFSTSAFENCGGQSGIGIDFSPTTVVFLGHYHSTNAAYLFLVTDSVDTLDSLVSIVTQFRVCTLVTVMLSVPIQTVPEARLAC